MTEEENSVRVRTPTKKSSVAVYFVLMLLGCVAIGISGEALELNPFISWGLAGVLLVGAIYWCFKLEKKHREKHPKQLKQAWEKAQRKRTAVVNTLILGITALLMIAGTRDLAFKFFALCIISYVFYLIYSVAYALVEPHAKDRKSATQLAITIIFVVVFIINASRQSKSPALENHPNPQQSTDDMSLQKSLGRMTPQQYQAILKMMSPQRRQESIESLSRSQRERLLPD